MIKQDIQNSYIKKLSILIFIVFFIVGCSSGNEKEKLNDDLENLKDDNATISASPNEEFFVIIENLNKNIEQEDTNLKSFINLKVLDITSLCFWENDYQIIISNLNDKLNIVEDIKSDITEIKNSLLEKRGQ